jgi:hypothetical protein
MNALDFGNVFITLLIFLVVLFVLFMIVRGLILWYWRINHIVHLLEQIERNTRPGQRVAYESAEPDQANEEEEVELYSSETIRITNKHLIVPPHEWRIEQFQPVKVEIAGGSYRINLLDRNGKRVHHLNSDDQERINLVAEAINKALGQ